MHQNYTPMSTGRLTVCVWLHLLATCFIHLNKPTYRRDSGRHPA